MNKRGKLNRAKPIALKEAIARLRSMSELVRREVRTALQLESSLESGNRVIRGEMRGVQFHGAPCYDTIKLGTQLYLALTLAKLFEIPAPRSNETLKRRMNRSDVASIPLLMNLLAQKRCQRKLSADARTWTPLTANFADEHESAATNAMDAALARYKTFRRSPDGKAALLRVERFRNRILAHNLLLDFSGSLPVYNDLFLLTDAARDIATHCSLAIEGHNPDLTELEESFIRISDSFWRPALFAARDYDGEGA